MGAVGSFTDPRVPRHRLVQVVVIELGQSGVCGGVQLLCPAVGPPGGNPRGPSGRRATREQCPLGIGHWHGVESTEAEQLGKHHVYLLRCVVLTE
jgi:hypothetical protein